MPTKFRPTTQKEKTTQIGIGLLLAFIFAIPLGFIMSVLFHWVGGFFNPSPNAPPDCSIFDVLGDQKTLAEHQACKDESNSFDAKFKRLESKVPWFWISFLVLAWTFLKNPLKGRMRDDSEDVTYDGKEGMDFLLILIIQIMPFICFWAFIMRDKASLIALGIGIAAILFWHLINKWLLKKYGQTKLERRSK